MTNEEIKEFKRNIKETIIPHIINLTDDKIKEIIDDVEKNNEECPKGFGSMLYQQILIAKYNKRAF